MLLSRSNLVASSASIGLLCATLFSSTAAAPAGITSPGESLPINVLARVMARLSENDKDSWVAGTECQALTELFTPNLSPFAENPFPISGTNTIPTLSNDIISRYYSNMSSTSTQFPKDSYGAAADPASLGVAWINAKLTNQSVATRQAYERIISGEIDFLLEQVPRTSSGAISHRPRGETPQIWADFIYMVPPFLAYRGVEVASIALLRESCNQINLYRNALRDPSTNLWKHVVLGDWHDNGLWGTGNAWAAAGMTRVLATIMKSQFAANLTTEIENLGTWANEILTAAFAQRSRTTGLLPNYYGPVTTFSDAASTALLAATAFRLDTLNVTQTATNVQTAVELRKAVLSNIDTTTGWLQNTVDPIKWLEQSNSPEGNAFVILLESAWNRWVNEE